VAGLAAAVTVVAVAAAGPAALASTRGSVVRPGLARVTAAPRLPLHTVAEGRVAGSSEITGAVGLKPRNAAALANFVAAVTNKHSASFGHYLAKGEFRTLFGPTTATVDAVTSTLRRAGLDVTSVASDGLLIDFRGSASRVEAAFHTGLERYRLADGSMGRGTTSAVRLPAAIARDVATVAGLDDLVHAQAVGLRNPARAAAARATFPAAKVPATALTHDSSNGPTACSAATADATTYGGLTDDAIAHSYGADGLYSANDTGAGQTIAVYELEPYLTSDLQAFDTCYFGATRAATMISNVHNIAVDGGQPTGPGSGEAILDVEDVSALAPGATVDVYSAPNNTFGGLDEYASMINTDSAHVITSSWGECEQDVQLAEPGTQQEENFLFQQAAAQGQSLFAAAGDTGDDSCNEARADIPPLGQNPLSVLDPASQPYVVAVGGTTITDATQPPAEQVWNDGGAWGAGGGGISETWPMPTWQQAATDTSANTTAVTAAETVESNYVTQFNDSGSGTSEASEATPTFCLGTLSPAPTACRELPDVSAQADEFTGAITIYSEAFVAEGSPSPWITIGGTSSATPLWAAMVALVDASSTCSSESVTNVGFVSPLLYGIAASPTAYAASFNDITVGNNDTYGFDDGAVFPAGTGYDMASGLGSPKLTGPGGTDGLAYYLCSYGHTGGLSAPTVTGISPASGTVAGGTTLTVTGSGFVTGDTSVTIGTTTVAAADVTVSSPTSLTVTTPAATVPPGSASPQDGGGSVDITATVSTTGLSSTPTASSVFDYVDKTSGNTVPDVTGVSPYGGLETAPTAVHIFGSGFTGATSVTFGGVDGTGLSVVSDNEITVTPPAYSSGSTTCHGDLPSGETATNDICQVQVVVTNSHGSSTDGTILPPYEGTALTLNAVSVPVAPAGTEEAPAPTEYDYVPAPTVTSVSTSDGPNYLASEFGFSTITVTGTGFNPMTLDWFNIGPSSDAASQDLSFSYLTGTEVQILAPEAFLNSLGNPSVDTHTMPFSVQTLGGLSNTENVTYAGVPTVSAVSITAAPDSGGTPFTIDGAGFDGQVQSVQFWDFFTDFSIGTQFTVNVTSDTQLSTQTVAQNPADVDAEVCTVTGCSFNPSVDQILLYPLGNPVVTSSSPSTGPAHGGTKVVILGQNLGCVTGVSFGSTEVSLASNAEALLDCGSSNEVIAYAPPGNPNTTVKITLTTVESLVTGFGSSAPTTAAEFHYTRSSPAPPLNLAVHPGNKKVHATWQAPKVDGGDLIDGYVVHLVAKGHPTITVNLPASARQVTVTGLVNGRTYTFEVSAKSKLGVGPAATESVKPKS
jgi:hypothetical protein